MTHHFYLAGTASRVILAAAALACAIWPASAQPDAGQGQQSAASQATTPKTMPPATAASKPPASAKRAQRTACVRQGGSCSAPGSRCCGNLVCVGINNSFCAAP